MSTKQKSQHGAKASARGGTSRARSSARTSKPKPSTRTQVRPVSNSRKAPARNTPARKPRGIASQGSAILVTLVLLVAVAAWVLYPAARVQYQEERNKARLEAELEVLKERNAELRAEVDRLKTPEGVEEVAREDLGLVKEGENLYVVMDSETPSETLPASPEPQLDDTAWLRVLDAVFGFEG